MDERLSTHTEFCQVSDSDKSVYDAGVFARSMSSRVPLAIFVILTIIFASFAAYEAAYPTRAVSTTASTIPATTTYTMIQVATSTLTQTSTITDTIIETSTMTLASDAYELVFRQVTACPNIGYFAPWNVTLSNGQSITALNANFSQPYSGSPNNPSIITFVVPNGNYSYTVTPPNRFTPGAGTVIVDNQEVVINLEVFMASCGSTTTTG